MTLGADSGFPLRWPVLLGSVGVGALSFLLPIYARQIGASALEIGGLFSIFSVFSLALRPIIGWAGDRLGRKVFFTTGLVGYALAMALFAVAYSVPVLYLARVVQGLGSGLLWGSAYGLAIDLASAGQRGRAVGLVDETSSRGTLYGSVLGFLWLVWIPIRAGWIALFVLFSALAAVAALLAGSKVPEARPSRSFGAFGLSTLSVPLIHLLVLVAIASVPATMLPPIVIVYLQDVFRGQALPWEYLLPVESRGYALVGLALLPGALMYALLPSRFGHLSDSFGRLPMMTAGLLMAGTATAFLPGRSDLFWLVLLLSLESLALVAAMPALEALVADLARQDVRGTWYGLYTTAAGLGALFGPLFGGWLYDAVGQGAPFYVGAFVLLTLAAYLLSPWGRRMLGIGSV